MSAGVDVEGGGRILGVAKEEVGAVLADGAEVVDREGAEGGVLVKECTKGLFSRDGDLCVLVSVAVADELAPFSCAGCACNLFNSGVRVAVEEEWGS